MKVVDFHIHVGVEEAVNPSVIKYLESVNPDIKTAFRVLKSPEETCKYLKAQGVSHAVALAEYSPSVTGVVSNEYVYGFTRNQRMLSAFASVNPCTMKKTPLILDDCVKNKGFCGLKLYPTYQFFYPNDEKLYPLYSKAEELGIPVMFHTGSSVFQGSRLKYGDPLYIDDVAVDFPELKLVLAHSGRPIWYNTAFQIARTRDNVYLEISGIPPAKLPSIFPNLDVISDRVIFGSDWPGTPGIAKVIRALRKLPYESRIINAILGGNACTLLGIRQ